MRSPAEREDWHLAHVARRHHQDLGFYSALARRTGGPVLELACGTGRLTVPLAAVGLDVDPGALAVARRRGARRLVCADMRRFTLAGRFGVVAIAYNSLQLLVDDDDVRRCLRCAAAHLAPEGVVAFEVSDFQSGAVRTHVEPELVATGDGVRLYGAVVHDLDRRVTTYHRRFEEAGTIVVDHVRLRCLDRDEVSCLLADAGLEAEEVTADRRRLMVAATVRRP